MFRSWCQRLLKNRKPGTWSAQRRRNHVRLHIDRLEDRLTPANLTAAVSAAGILTLTETSAVAIGGITVVPVTPVTQATFGELTVGVPAGDTINSGGTTFTTTRPITALTVKLGSGADTLTIGDTTFATTLSLPGGLTISGSGGNKVLAVDNVNLRNAAKLSVSLAGNGTETSTFTNVNVGGAAAISHPGVGNTTLTITNNLAAGPNVAFNWGSLSITNGQGADANTINDTNFAGNLTINNGPGDGTPGGNSSTVIAALNDQTLTTIGGNVSIATASGMSDSEVYDCNINGNVTINTGPGIAGQMAGSVAGLANKQSVATSGIPAIGGKVNITGTVVAGSSLTVNVGAGNPVIIHGSLTVSATGTGVIPNGPQAGSVTVNLSDLRIASGATNIMLGAQTSGDTVNINAANTVAHYNGLTITSTGGGNNNFNIQNMAGETDFGGSVSLHLAGSDTITIGDVSQNPPPNEDGTVNINGNLAITGTGTKVITVQGARLSGTGNLNISLTGLPAVGNYAMQATFRDTAIAGAGTVSDPTYAGSGFTITSSGSASPNTVFKWGSLSITNGEDGRVFVGDTDFGGNVTINNGGNDDGDGNNAAVIGAVNDQKLATIGGNVTINNASGPPSDTEVYDYNVKGNVTINSAHANSDFVGLENIQTFPGSGIPVIGGNVTISVGSGGTGNGATATIDVGTGGEDPYNFPPANTNNPLLIAGNLTIAITGAGVLVDLNDLSVPNGTTSLTLGSTGFGAGDTVKVQGSSVTSVFDNFNITAPSNNGNTFNIQDQAGTIEFGGAVNIQLGAGSTTVNVGADVNNTTGVANALVELFGTTTIAGHLPKDTNMLFGAPNKTPNANILFFVTPVVTNFTFG